MQEKLAYVKSNINLQCQNDDKPVSIKDDKEHMLYWLVEVPANGKSEIEHSVTITAPVKLELLPDVP